MWLNAVKDDTGDFICQGKTRETMAYELNQLKKWRIANPEAEIIFWYDSHYTNEKAIENTKECLAEISGNNPLIQLRDIREIPFVQANTDFFLPTIPIYFKIDFLKLITCLYLMENEGMFSAIFTDMSIGDKIERVLSQPELYNEDALNNLKQFGMLIGHDSTKPENQFLQMLNTPELIMSLKHAINCCLFLVNNALNNAIELNNPNIIKNLNMASFVATMVHVHLYFLVLQSKEPIKIRADVVKEGTKNDWVTYDPEKHGYVMFGNSLKTFELGSVYSAPDSEGYSPLSAIVKLPESLGLIPNINSFLLLEQMLPDMANAVRKDLHPGHVGGSHYWASNEIPLPTHTDKFHCTFWPQQENHGLDQKNDDNSRPGSTNPVF